VSKTLGKGPNTLGKAFAQCHTRQRAHGKILAGKGSLPSVFYRALGKGFAECRHSAEKKLKKSQKNRKKNCFFVVGLPLARSTPKVIK